MYILCYKRMPERTLKDGTKLYFENGKLHSYNGPAVIYKDGQTEYWMKGRRCRFSGYALISDKFKIKIRNSKVVRKHVLDNISTDTIQDYINVVKRTHDTLSNASLEELGLHEREWEENHKGITRYYKDGIQHREDGPAEEMENGTNIYMMYGLKHREDGPAMIDKKYKSDTWYHYGMVHREDGPAMINYENRNKKIRNEAWVYYSHIHRVGGPAMIDINEQTGEVVYEAWYINGKYHREDGPCKIMHIHDIFMEKPTGEVVKIWMEDGFFHRLGGPAVESHSYNWYSNFSLPRLDASSIEAKPYNDWYINGVRYKEEDYHKLMKNVLKVCSKFKKPLRRGVKNAIYDCEIYGISKDICGLISEYVY